MTQKRTKKNIFNESDYKIIRELYYLNKGVYKLPRLPMNDSRRARGSRIIKQAPLSFRKALSRIAAMW